MDYWMEIEYPPSEEEFPIQLQGALNNATSFFKELLFGFESLYSSGVPKLKVLIWYETILGRSESHRLMCPGNES